MTENSFWIQLVSSQSRLLLSIASYTVWSGFFLNYIFNSYKLELLKCMEMYFNFKLYIIKRHLRNFICPFHLYKTINFNIFSDSDLVLLMEWKHILNFYEQFDNFHILNVVFTVTFCKICIYTHQVNANFTIYLFVHFL